jgi:hypothetical protein
MNHFPCKTLKTAAKTRRMLKYVFREETVSHTRTFEWTAPFTNGRISAKDDAYLSCSLSLHTEDIHPCL